MGAGTDIIIALINNPRVLWGLISAVLSMCGVTSWNWFEAEEQATVYKGTTEIYAKEAARQHTQIVDRVVTNTTVIKTDTPRMRSIESKVNALEDKVEKWHGR